MDARFTEFRRKEIIDIQNGMKIGYADDIIFDAERAEINSLVIFGRLRFFGLFGRGEELIIPWGEIEKIGEDTILIRASRPYAAKPQKFAFFDDLFG